MMMSPRLTHDDEIDSYSPSQDDYTATELQ